VLLINYHKIRHEHNGKKYSNRKVDSISSYHSRYEHNGKKYSHLAKKGDGYYRVNGQKKWITYGMAADFMSVACRTGDKGKSKSGAGSGGMN